MRLTKDEWLWVLGTSPWDEPTNEKVEHELWRIAQEIVSLGVSVVLDFGLRAREERAASVAEPDEAVLGVGVGGGIRDGVDLIAVRVLEDQVAALVAELDS